MTINSQMPNNTVLLLIFKHYMFLHSAPFYPTSPQYLMLYSAIKWAKHLQNCHFMCGDLHHI